MMKIRLKEREEAILSTLPITTTFKIPESSFVFMKVDVDGLTVRQKPKSSPGAEPEESDVKVIKVLIPEEKTTVVCVSTGKVQFLSIYENVQIVDLDCEEIAKEKKAKVVAKPEQHGGVRRPDEDSSS
jgi:hypothetical protein